MPLTASGSKTTLWYAIEDSSGNIHATTPEFFPIRFNTEGLNRDTAQVESNEINSRRQRPVARQGTYSVNGTIVADLFFGAHDYLMQAALQSTWRDQDSITATTISAAASDNSYNDSGNGFVTAGFAVGDRVTVTGFTGNAANNTEDAIITSVAAGKIIVSGPTLVDDAAGESVTITTAGDILDVGTTPPMIAILERETDTGQDTIYRHCRVGGLDLAVVLNQAVTISAPVLGEEQEDYTVPGGATFNTPTSTGIFVPTIGYMHESAVARAHLIDYNLQLSNNMDPRFALFQRPAYDIGNGLFTASGTMTTYLIESDPIWDKYIAETNVTHIVKLEDQDGNWYRFILGSVNYTQATKETSGPGAKQPQYTIAAGDDGVTTVRIERSS